MATPHTLLELYSQLRIQLPTLPLFTFQRPDIPANRRPSTSSVREINSARSAILACPGEVRRPSFAHIRPASSLRDFAAAGFLRLERRTKPGGADGVRTHDLLVANQALSQLSYGPRVNAECRRQISLILACPGVVRRIGRGPPGFTAEAASPGQSSSAANAANEAWWAQVDSNHRPRPYQGRALAN